MALYQGGILLVLFILVVAGIQATNGALIKGSVTCLDCDGDDLSGIKVLVKCSKVKKVEMATTSKDGSFETKLANENPLLLKCFVKILGGPTLLYAKSNNIASKVVKIHGGRGHEDYYTNSEPLNVYKSCPANYKYAKCSEIADTVQFGSSKTVDLPLPREWGLAPTSYYFPFIPIIGIP